MRPLLTYRFISYYANIWSVVTEWIIIVVIKVNFKRYMV